MRMPRMSRRSDDPTGQADLEPGTPHLGAASGDTPAAGEGDEQGPGPSALTQALSGVTTIPTFTAPDLHSSMVPGVRFAIATKGYHFPQVEKFVAQVAEAMSVLERGVNEAHQALHNTDNELAQALYDNQRLRAQMEVFRVQGDPLVHADGSYVRESEVAEQAATAQELAAAQAEVQSLRAQVEQFSTDNAHLRAMEVSLQDEVASLRSWGQQIGAELLSTREQNLALAQDNDMLRSTLGAAPGPQTAATIVEGPAVMDMPPAPHPDSTVPAADSPVGGATQQPVVEPSRSVDYMDESVAAQFAAQIAAETRAGTGTTVPVTVPAIESELPEGVEPPGTGEYTYPEYPTAAPGVPLSNGEVPLETWAPEVANRT